MREAFETWAKSRYMPLRLSSAGEYWIETTQSAWEAWRASRESLIDDMSKLGWAPCVLQEAIDAAGLEDGN